MGQMTQTTERFTGFDYGFTAMPPVPMKRDGSTALLIIDMQYNDASPDQGFNLAMAKVAPGCMDYFNERVDNVVIPAIGKLLAYFREHDLPVIYVVVGSPYHDYRDWPRNLREWFFHLERETGMKDLFWTGNPTFAVRKEIEPRSGEPIIRKTSCGAFNSSNIDQILRNMGVENLVVTGISTNACVETTVRGAAERSYLVSVVDEATADYDEEAHDAALRCIYFTFGRVAKTADQIIAALKQESTV
jgi:nicotinamidase-related amidase